MIPKENSWKESCWRARMASQVTASFPEARVSRQNVEWDTVLISKTLRIVWSLNKAFWHLHLWIVLSGQALALASTNPIWWKWCHARLGLNLKKPCQTLLFTLGTNHHAGNSPCPQRGHAEEYQATPRVSRVGCATLVQPLNGANYGFHPKVDCHLIL